jgi:hypothetical protein
VLAAGALTGCASGQSGATPSAPTGTTETPVETVDVSAAWLDGGAMIAVILQGGSNCRPFADEVAYDDGVLEVSMMDADGACTHDSVPRGLAVALPEGVDAAQDLRVQVRGAGYRGETDLPGAEGLTPGGGLEGGRPSAGWAGPDTFALLTWGSSSCQPQVESAAPAADGEIAVTFVTPPADQVCTADMAPRVTVVQAPGVTAGSAYEAVLAGATFDGVRVAIAGRP